MKKDDKVAPLCKCGCGEKVKWSENKKCWNTFLNGHNSSLSREEARLRAKEQWKDPERRSRHSKFMTEQWNDLELREKCSKRMLALWSDSVKRGIVRQREKKRWNAPELREKYSKRAREQWRNPNLRAETTQRWNDPELREKYSLRMKESWKDPITRAKMLVGRGLVGFPSPNKLELYFDELTPDCVEFVGNGTWWRTLPNSKHKNPDFKIRGQKKIIEIHGNYWHEGEDVTVLIEMFHRIGYECLIIWEKDLRENPDQVVELVQQFIGEENLR